MNKLIQINVILVLLIKLNKKLFFFANENFKTNNYRKIIILKSSQPVMTNQFQFTKLVLNNDDIGSFNSFQKYFEGNKV